MSATVSDTAVPSRTEKTYDEIGPAYEDAFEGLPTQLESVQWLLSSLGPGSKVVDVGCGTGRPVCSMLAAAGHDVLGIDLSSAMVNAARERVPQAKFQHIDFRSFKPEPASYDAVTLYFSLIAGVTQDEIRQALRSVYGWLRPGGLLVWSTVPIEGENVELKWMGNPVVVSGLSPEDSVEAVKQAGFEIVRSDTSTWTPKAVEAGICGPEDVWEEPHLFTYAKKPR